MSQIAPTVGLDVATDAFLIPREYKRSFVSAVVDLLTFATNGPTTEKGLVLVNSIVPQSTRDTPKS